MKLALNPRLAAVAAPPIAEAHSWIEGRRFPQEKPLIDVAQAVPGYPPPPALTDHLAAIVGDAASARYTDILGLPALRAALARDMGDFYGAAIAAEDVGITAGCNQAFCLALLALARAGEEVILPLPYYFNHQMWFDMQGITARHLPLRPERGGVPDPADAAALIGPKTRAIVLVTPNNPTGAIYPPEVIAEFFHLARRHDLALVLDETYRDFLPTDDAPHGLFAEPGWRDTLVQLYSFSKVYCLTGYRVGSIIAGPALLAEVAKAMDTVAICAPRLGQMAAINILALNHQDARAPGRFAEEPGAQRSGLSPGQCRCLFRLSHPSLRRPARHPGRAAAGGRAERAGAARQHVRPGAGGISPRRLRQCRGGGHAGPGRAPRRGCGAGVSRNPLPFVIPAKAGIQGNQLAYGPGFPLSRE